MINHVIALVLDAGALILTELQRPGGPRGRGDKADVDIEIEVMLRSGLRKILGCDFVGEETGRHLTGDAYCWVVDPNDGTTDFLAGRTGSAISIGLLHEGVPVLGIVYAPASPRGPDCIAWQVGMSSIFRNGQSIELPRGAVGLHRSVVFVSSAAESKRAKNDALCSPAVCEPMPSIAYRLARTAAGDGAAAVSLYSVAPHDLVAGHALLLAAGGDLFNQNGQPIRYTASAEFSTPVQRCFGGEAEACISLAKRSWGDLLPLNAGINNRRLS